MERNIGAPNRRIPPDVRPMGSASRDLDREETYEEQTPAQEPDAPDASVVDED